MPLKKLIQSFVVNKTKTNESVLVQCSSTVKKDAVKRETIDGKEHIIVSSYTLPDNIVMNDILYPADEIESSFMGINGTPAPLGHPQNANGDYVSATSAPALNNYYVGATNANVRREDGRVHVDKIIDVEVANRTENGKKLLERIADLETNQDAQPIHTSTGIWLQMEVLNTPQTNEQGKKYAAIARNMQFDHDAILLDEIGAGTPDDGVGMAVNEQGQTLQVNRITIPDADGITPNIGETEMSHEEIREALYAALTKSYGEDTWIHRVYSQSIIFEDRTGYRSIAYVLDAESGEADLIGQAEEVEKNETFTPKFNHEEGEIMKEMILNALKDAGVDVAELDDEALLKAYQDLSVNAQDPADEPSGDEANAQITDLQAQLNELKSEKDAKQAARIDELATIVGNSDQYSAITVEDAKALSLDMLEKFAASCRTATGLPHVTVNAGSAYDAPTDLPA